MPTTPTRTPTRIPRVTAGRVRLVPTPAGWRGVRVSTQAEADAKVPLLLDQDAAVRFVWCEPVEAVDLRRLTHCEDGQDLRIDALSGEWWHDDTQTEFTPAPAADISWLIVSGQCGPDARPCNVDWIRSLIAQSSAAGVPCFVWRIGSNPTWTYWSGKPLVPIEQPYCATSRTMRDGIQTRTRLNSRNGANPDEWPEGLRVREFPQVARVGHRAAGRLLDGVTKDASPQPTKGGMR